MKTNNKTEKGTIEVFFIGGAIALIEYEIEELVDDYVWEDFRNGWEGNKLWFPTDWADFEIKIGGELVDEIDMRKVIGAKYN